MTIWRGEGGGGDATTDSEINLITALANSIVADTATTTAAAASATASELAAQASEDAAAISETNAASSAAAALVSEGAASVSAAAALVSETNAAASALSVNDTNLVHIAGTETITGAKTFSATISGSIDGNAATVTNGVYTTGDQTIGGNKTFSNTVLGSVSGATGTFSGNVQMASANGGQLAGLRNKIINGNMTVLQRGTGAVTTNVAGTAFYVADRFFGATLATGAVVAAGNAPSSTLSLSGTSTIFLQTSTAKAVLGTNDYAYLSQYIEGNNVADLKFGTASAKTITVSFRARADSIGATAVITVSLRNGANNRAYCAPVTITNANASYSVTIPGDTSGTWLTDTGIGLRVGFGFAGNGTSIASTDNAWVASGAVMASTQTNFLGTATASLNITDVQLEVGQIPTPFEQIPYGLSLQLCQRYYEVLPQSGTGSIQASIGTGQNTSTTAGSVPITFKVTKRATPGVTSSGLLRVSSAAGGDVTVTSTSFIGLGLEGAVISYGVASGLTQGFAALFGRRTDTTGEIQISAEL
jgi:hypothetical protein